MTSMYCCESSDNGARVRLLAMQAMVAVALLLVAAAQPAAAQNDYYRASSDKAIGETLYQVELHHLNQGLSNLRAGQYQYAYQDIAFILKYFPNHPQALKAFSELCQRWKQPARCSNTDERFEKAIEINPGAADTYTIQGIHLQNAGRLDSAIQSYKKALERNPSSVYAHYNLGLAYADKKDFVRANEQAQKAYGLGMTLPGLRNKLTRAGAWKPLSKDAERASPAASSSQKNP